ncbi:MAG: NAD(P)H-dependent oxidoreductase [Armatimonadota bacterium]
MRVLIAYHSEDGHTEKLAQAVGEGAREVGDAEVEVRAIDAVSADDLRRADAILLGSPVYGGTVSHQMKRFMDTTMGEVWMSGELAGKTGGAFATCGGEHGGIESTLETILRVMLGCSMVVTGPYVKQEEIRATGAAYGATFVPRPGHEELSDADRKLARSLGRRVAEVAGALAGSPAAERQEGQLSYAA